MAACSTCSSSPVRAVLADELVADDRGVDVLGLRGGARLCGVGEPLDLDADVVGLGRGAGGLGDRHRLGALRTDGVVLLAVAAEQARRDGDRRDDEDA